MTASLPGATTPFYLLDTNILVHYIRQDDLQRQTERTYGLLSNPGTLISVVTEGEIRALALQFGWGQQRLRLLQGMIAYFTIVPVPFAGIVDAYARIDDYSLCSGITMGKNDILVTAAAQVTGARLLTTDRDFDHLVPTFLACDWIDPNTTSPVQAP